MSYKKIICMTIALLFLLSFTLPINAWDGKDDGLEQWDGRGHPWQDDNQYEGDPTVQSPRITIIVGPFVKAINIEIPSFLRKVVKKKGIRNQNIKTSRTRSVLEKRVSLRGARTR